MGLSQVHHHKSTIVAHLIDAIDKAFSNIHQDEPQLIANLVHHLVYRFNKYIAPLFALEGVTAQSGGVFVHQRPTAALIPPNTFPASKPKSVELGDLLLVLSLTEKGVTDRVAMLLQAKKVSSIPTTLGSSRNQHHLYAHWPPFEYQIPSSLRGNSRHITGPGLYQGGKYLLINQNGRGMPVRLGSRYALLSAGAVGFTAEPHPGELSGYRDFEDELYAFLFGNAGRAYVSPPSIGSIGWDQVIEDLISGTAKLATTWMKGASAGGDQSRHRGLFLCGFQNSLKLTAERILLRASADWDNWCRDSNGPPDVPPEIDTNIFGEGGGISIVEFAVTVNDEGGHR
ncbi:MAG: hypothetical protein HQL90_05265 [Magnetococcales bacterium]|nr:hypothetical protein [Magnetococcales bacterium]